MDADYKRCLEDFKRRLAALPPEKRLKAKELLLQKMEMGASVARNIDAVIQEADEDFCKGTSFDKKDWSFLAFCLGLQVVRQYVFTDFEKRLSDKEAAARTEGHGLETSNRVHRLYHPSVEEIVSNPVPFDAMMGSPKFNANLAGPTHRFIPGHDPLIGYVVGTMNILTSTVTGFKGQSFHVKTGFTKKGANRDCLVARADNAKILYYTRKRIFEEGPEGVTAFVTALLKEHIHLKSDLKSHYSLPLPAMTIINPDLARELSKYGLDMLNVLTVGKQAFGSVLVNMVIAVLHRMMMPEGADERLYKAKTKKIIAYANALATSSNLFYTSLTDQWNKLDVGGSLVSICEIIKTSNFLTDLQISMRNENLKNHLKMINHVG